MSEDRVSTVIPDALQLVDAVRRFDRRDVRHLIHTADLPAVAVVLAAMVDQDRTASDLLGWVEEQDTADGWLWSDVLAAHAQYELCRARGVDAPEDVRAGQRVYDRVRARRRYDLVRKHPKAGAA